MPRKAPRSAIVQRDEFLRRAEVRSLRISRQLRSVVRQTWASPELLHDLHRQLRQARLDLRVLRRGSRKAHRQDYEEADAALADLADLTGHARDLDVSATLLRSLAVGARGPLSSRRGSDMLQRRLTMDRQHARLELRRDALRALERGRVRLPRTVGASDPRAEERFGDAARREILRRDRDLRRAMVRAHRRPTASRLHEMRIALRRTRNLWAALAHPSTREPFPETWRKLQRDLEDHHDLTVLDRWVARHAVHPEGAKLRREVRRAILAREERARERLLRAIEQLEGKLPRDRRP